MNIFTDLKGASLNLSKGVCFNKIKVGFTANPFFLIFLSSILSLVIFGLINPDFLKFNVSQIRFGEYSIPYIANFNNISNFLQHRIGLWNSYDQMPFAYHILCDGFNLSIVKLSILINYFIFSPFFESLGVALHRIFSIFYPLTCVLVQSTGVYLLIRRFASSRWVIFFSLVYINVLLSYSMLYGTGVGDMYIYIPFLMHFLLKLFEDFSLNNFLKLIFTGAVVAYVSTIESLYIYQFIHAVLLSAIVVNFSRIKNAFSLFIKRPPSFYKISFDQFKKCLMVLILLCVILGPYLYLAAHNSGDYYFGPQKTRFENIFSIAEYFKRPIFYAKQSHFLANSMNPIISESNVKAWALDWHFLGVLTIFLTIVGAITFSDRRKYIFLLAILMLFLLNTERNAISLGGLAHLINAMTNPFKFAVYSFHMIGAMTLPYLLVSLITMGFSSIYEAVFKQRKVSGKQIAVAVCFLGGIMLYCGVFNYFENTLSNGLISYLGISSLVFAAFLAVWRMFVRSKTLFIKQTVLFSIFISWFAYEALAVSLYMRPILEAMLVHPLILNEAQRDLENPKNIRIHEHGGPIYYDYQNPNIYPFRYYFNSQIYLPMSGYFMTEVLNMIGSFVRYTNLERYFYTAFKHNPVHKSYQIFAEDGWMQRYLIRENRMFYFAEKAVCSRNNNFQAIVSRDLNEKLITVADNTLVACPDNLDDWVGKNLKGEAEKPIVEMQCKGGLLNSFPSTRFDRGEFVKIYSMDLPDNFPREISSTIFTDDAQFLQASIGNVPLRQTQGKPVLPMSFDVQNYKTNKLSIGLPLDFNEPQIPIQICYPNGPINGIKVLKYQPDYLEFLHEKSKEGWLIFHYPFDKKWKVEIDGRRTEIFKVNEAFLGFPVSKGSHKITIEYWPDTALRLFLVLAGLVSSIGFIVLIYFELKTRKNVTQNSVC